MAETPDSKKKKKKIVAFRREMGFLMHCIELALHRSHGYFLESKLRLLN